MLISVAVIVLLSAVMEGCGFLGRTYVIEEPFTEKQVDSIRHGETTKKDLLQWFGPPLVVARPGASIMMPQQGSIKSGSLEIPADGLFERFKASLVRPLVPLLYYYEDTALSWVDVSFYTSMPIPTKPTVTVKRLWILIDEKSGTVVDHRMEKMVEGKPQQETVKKPLTNAAGVEIP